MKKLLPLIFIVLLLIAGFFGYKFLNKKAKPAEEPTTISKVKVEKVNQLPLEQRPYIIIEPKSQTRPQDLGSWITVTIDKVDNYQSVEYDVEYQAGSLIQGFMHRIDFSKETPPYFKEGFFGSESKGKYKYDENVKSGNILFKFFKDSSNYDALKTYFNLQNMQQENGVFSSNDTKAVLTVTAGNLTPQDYIVIASTLGLPEQPRGEVISEPYGFYAARQTKLTKASLTIKTGKDFNSAKILGWDGKTWQEYETTTQQGEATAQVDQLGTFVLVNE